MQLTHVRKSATKKNTILYFHVTLKGDIYRLHTTSERTELSNKNEDISNLTLAKAKDFLKFKEARGKLTPSVPIKVGDKSNFLTLDEAASNFPGLHGKIDDAIKVNTDGYITGFGLEALTTPGIVADYVNVSTPSAKLDSQLKNDFKWLYSIVGKELEKVLQKHPDATFTGVSINYEVKKEDVINIEL